MYNVPVLANFQFLDNTLILSFYGQGNLCSKIDKSDNIRGFRYIQLA